MGSRHRRVRQFHSSFSSSPEQCILPRLKHVLHYPCSHGSSTVGPDSNACKKPTRINACLNLDIIATSVVFRQQNSNNSTQRNQCVSTKSQRTSSNRRQKTPKLMSLYKTLHSASTFQNIDVQKNVLGQLANGKCPPLCPIKKIWPFILQK